MSLTHFRERSHYDESNLTPEEFAVAPRTKEGRFSQEFNTIAINYSKLDVVHTGRFSDRASTSTKFFVTNLDRPRFTADPGDSPIGLLPAVEPEDPFVPGVAGQMIGRDRHYRNFGFDSRVALAYGDGGGRTHALQWGGRAERHHFHDRRTAEGTVRSSTPSIAACEFATKNIWGRRCPDSSRTPSRPATGW